MFEKLLEDLAGSGARVEKGCGTAEGVACAAYQERVFDPVVVLRISPALVDAHITATAQEAGPVFPDVSSETAAYRLLLEHVLIALRNDVRSGGVISLRDGAVRLEQDREAPAAPAGGDFHWSASPGWNDPRR